MSASLGHTAMLHGLGAEQGQEQPEDQVARWEELGREYPRAEYRRSGGFFCGRLRPGDAECSHSGMRQMIDGLLAREPRDSAAVLLPWSHA